MNKLWAPWRDRYLVKIYQKQKGCVFCRIQKEKKDYANFIFKRTAHSYAVLNIYPYNNGHCLIIPNRHVKDLSSLGKEERNDLFDLQDATVALLKKTLRPKGFNIGINIGRAAGAGFPGHVHIHIVPRWLGDVNFMPVLNETKVISQSLQSLWKILKNADKK